VIRSPSFPYVAPFAIFLGLLALHLVFPLPDAADQIVIVAVMAAVLWFVARPVIDFRVRNVSGTLLIGVLVFALWIGPDLLFPAYRQSWLFQNSLTGTSRSTLSSAGRVQPLVLVFRVVRAVAIVPIIEELFWRTWLMRWLITPDFRETPLGAYTARSFWIVALLFASEHGSYWDVGLAAGIAYNWWMVRTKSLGDLILAHAVTNGCLCFYVLMAGKWEYWL
jgi:CAAX prenyl protease-like protein